MKKYLVGLFCVGLILSFFPLAASQLSDNQNLSLHPRVNYANSVPPQTADMTYFPPNGQQMASNMDNMSAMPPLGLPSTCSDVSPDSFNPLAVQQQLQTQYPANMSINPPVLSSKSPYPYGHHMDTKPLPGSQNVQPQYGHNIPPSVFTAPYTYANYQHMPVHHHQQYNGYHSAPYASNVRETRVSPMSYTGYGYYGVPPYNMYGAHQRNALSFPNAVIPAPFSNELPPKKPTAKLKTHKNEITRSRKKCKKHQHKSRAAKKESRQPVAKNAQVALTINTSKENSCGDKCEKLVNKKGEYICQEKVDGVKCGISYLRMDRLKSHLMMSKKHHPDNPSVKCALVNCKKLEGVYSISGIAYHINKDHTEEDKKNSKSPYYVLVHKAWALQKIAEFKKKLANSKKRKKHSCKRM